MMLRRKLEEQAELQQAIELQGRRLINLQLPDIRGDYIHRHQRSLSVSAPISLPTHTAVKQNVCLTSDGKNQEVQGNCDNSAAAYSSVLTAAEKNLQQEVNFPCSQKNNTVNGKEGGISEICDVHDCHKSNVEHALPDNLFASPTKSSENQQPTFSSELAEVKETTELSVTSSFEHESSVPTNSTGNGHL
uniref:Uncharacterized protein n=1 Tax=Rhizophora mucronata TaxID=61149 RepID=A0A2P2LH79_RHIMU